MTQRIELSQGFSAIVDNEDYQRVSEFKWSAERSYPPIVYACRKVRIDGKQKLIRLHRFITDAPVGMEVDHINGDGLDNRKRIPRVCDRGENARNQRLCKASSTGFKGVTFDVERGKFAAKVNHRSRTIHLGRFNDAESAARAYDAKAKELFGEFANVNFKGSPVSLTLCPICSAICKDHVNNSPYWICPNCDVWTQDPAPPKVYHGTHETWRDKPMPEDERAANEALADQLFREQMGGKPGPTLDIGADYPILASRFNARGCKALAIDGEPHTNDLDVASVVLDLERQEFPKELAPNGFALITCVHVFEHLYRPVEALRKLRQLVADDGRVFIRSPDHCVPGYERDLTPGHFSIHPFYHSLTSILECCAQAGDCFEVERYDQMQPGQMNVILRPII